MAASNQKSDLAQIVMLTFFLCAIFFTGWGLYSTTRVNSLEKERSVQAQRLKDLQKELAKKESQQIVKDERRRKQSAENSTQIDTAVQAVLAGSGLSLSKGEPSPPKTSGPAGNRVEEFSYSAEFKPADIDQVYRFLAMIEAQQPHLEFKKIKIRSKRRKPEDPDLWELDVTLVTYRLESGS